MKLNILEKTSIKQRIWAGFSIILAILFVVVASTFMNLKNVESEVSNTTDMIVPALVQSAELMETVVSMGQYLGYYMLTQKDEYRAHYRDDFIQSQTVYNKMIALLGGHYAQTDAIFSHLEQDFSALENQMEIVDELVLDDASNYPALSHAAKFVNVPGQALSQLISGMVQSESDESPDAERRKLLLNLGSLRYTWANTLSTFRVYLAMRNQQAIDEILLQREQIDSLLALMGGQRSLMNLDQDDSFSQILTLKPAIFDAIDEVIIKHSSKQWRKDAYILETEIIPLISKIELDINELIEDERSRLEHANSELLRGVNQNLIQSMIMALVALVIGVAVAYFNSTGVATLINGMRGVFKKLEEGDMTFVPNLGQSLEAREVEVSLNQFSDNMRDAIGRIHKEAVQLNGTAEKLGGVIVLAGQASQAQDGQTSQVVIAMNEMASTVREIAQSAETAAKFAQEANVNAESGQDVAQEAISGVDVLANEVKAAGTVIENLQQECGSIGSVLDVIRGIAEQTNLLALNAAIEAARAGEHGRGFAVVADEVRSLASRTQQSTTEIQNMIERLQTGAADAVSVMSDARQGAESSSGQIERAATALSDIAIEVAKVNGLITQIASSTEEQSSVANEILQNVDSINELGKQGSERSKDMIDANDDLQIVATKLQQVVERFTI